MDERQPREQGIKVWGAVLGDALADASLNNRNESNEFPYSFVRSISISPGLRQS